MTHTRDVFFFVWILEHDVHIKRYMKPVPPGRAVVRRINFLSMGNNQVIEENSKNLLYKLTEQARGFTQVGFTLLIFNLHLQILSTISYYAQVYKTFLPEVYLKENTTIHLRLPHNSKH